MRTTGLGAMALIEVLGFMTALGGAGVVYAGDFWRTNPLEQAKAAQRAAQTALGRRLTELGVLDLGGGVMMKLELIPAGELGPSPGGGLPSRVRIPEPFFLAATEVTQAQFMAVTGTSPSHFPGGLRPVDSVTWDGAVGFCAKLSAKIHRPVRLPTEAECRSPDTLG